MPALTPQITLAGKLVDLNGAAIPNGGLVVQLVGFGATVPRVFGTGLIADIEPVKILGNGTGDYNFVVWGNDQITPANTYYVISVVDTDGNVVQTGAYQFAGTQNYDLANLVPFVPPPVVPAAPAVVGALVNVAYDANAVFNCGAVAAGALTFQMTVTGNLTGPTVINAAPGQLVSFKFKQDGVGGRTINWPLNVHNATDLQPAANTVTTQLFLVDDVGQLWPCGPGMWS